MKIFSLLATNLAMLAGLGLGCDGVDTLSRVHLKPDSNLYPQQTPDSGPYDYGVGWYDASPYVVYDGGVYDGSPGLSDAFYIPPPNVDAGPVCPQPVPGVSFVIVRWSQQQGSCWFLSSRGADAVDDLCEDSLPATGSYCQVLGSDWGAEQGLGMSIIIQLPCCPDYISPD